MKTNKKRSTKKTGLPAVTVRGEPSRHTMTFETCHYFYESERYGRLVMLVKRIVELDGQAWDDTTRDVGFMEPAKKPIIVDFKYDKTTHRLTLYDLDNCIELVGKDGKPTIVCQHIEEMERQS